MTNLPRMPLAISTLACPDWSLPQIVDACVASGIAGVEFRGLGSEIDITRSPAFTTDLDSSLALLWDKGLRLPCFATSVTLVSPGPERWQAMLEECHRYAELARRTGTLFLRIFGGATTSGLTDDEALTMARRHLKQVIKICKPRGLTPLLETHDAFATAHAARVLLSEFEQSEVGVLWDLEHSARTGDAPGDVVETLGRRIRYVHIKDSVRDTDPGAPRHNVPKLLGQGDLPLNAALAALRALGYTGWFSLESEKRWHPDAAPAPEIAIPHFAAWMRTHG